MTDHSELKQLAETATQGEWGFSGSNIAPLRREKDGAGYVEIWRSVAQAYNPDNAKFIAKANPAAVLALIAEVEALRKDAERLNFIESQNHRTLRFYKKRWSFEGFTNYEYSVFKSLREAIDSAMGVKTK